MRVSALIGQPARRPRRAAGLDDKLIVDRQLFLLEDVKQMAFNTKIFELEKPVIGALAEELEFNGWQKDPSEYPVTSLPANEAVHAAKMQSAAAAEELDMALRLAFWRDSRCISMRHEILDIAHGCSTVDVDVLREAIDDGRARGGMLRTYFTHRDRIQGNPHFFLADGGDIHNPGITFHQSGQPGAGFIVLDFDDPTVYTKLVERAAAPESLKVNRQRAHHRRRIDRCATASGVFGARDGEAPAIGRFDEGSFRLRDPRDRLEGDILSEVAAHSKRSPEDSRNPRYFGMSSRAARWRVRATQPISDTSITGSAG